MRVSNLVGPCYDIKAVVRPASFPEAIRDSKSFEIARVRFRQDWSPSSFEAKWPLRVDYRPPTAGSGGVDRCGKLYPRADPVSTPLKHG